MWFRYPLVRLALPLILGMSGAAALMGYIQWNHTVCFVVMCSLLMVLVVTHNVYAHTPLFRRLFTAAIFLLVLLFGATLYVLRYEHVATAVDVRQTNLRGIVATTPWRTQRSVALDLTTDDRATLRLFLQPSADHDPLTLQRGDTLLVSPLHLRSTCPLPHDTTDFAAYRRYLFFNGIAATCYVPAHRWQHTPSLQRDTTWNERLHTYYHQSSLDSTTRTMVEALTIGRRQGLTPQLRSQYAAAGVSHVLALSGMHLGLIVGLLDLLILRFILYRQRRWFMLGVIPLLWIFAYVAGMPPSLVRATLMATFFQLGFALGRQQMLPNSLALAAIVMLCANPLLLQNVGFQLSFLSMVGVACVFVLLFLSVSPSAKDTMPHIPLLMRIIRYFITLMMMTVSCTLFTAPLVACHFGTLPVYSLVTNLAVPPIVTLLMYATVLWLLLAVWPAAQTVLGHLLDRLVSLQNQVVETIAAWPAATIEFRPTALVTVLLYLALFGLVWFLFRVLGKNTPSA